MLVGITGGIGAGKSVVSRLLRCKGLSVYDCDSEARKIMQASVAVKRAVAERLGQHCIFPDGSLNRKAIAEFVFSDDNHRLWLNSLVHGLVRNDVMERYSRRHGRLLFVESAILHSSGLDILCDRIWLVDAPEELRVVRACGRDGADASEIKARMKVQEMEFNALPEFKTTVLENDGNKSLISQLKQALFDLEME